MFAHMLPLLVCDSFHKTKTILLMSDGDLLKIFLCSNNPAKASVEEKWLAWAKTGGGDGVAGCSVIVSQIKNRKRTHSVPVS